MLLLHDNPSSIIFLHDDLLHDDDGEWGTSRPLGDFDFSCCFDLSLTQRFYT
jgi:hypothetical protein